MLGTSTSSSSESADAKQNMSVNDLQDDLLYRIYEYMGPVDLARLAGVNNKFRCEHERITKMFWQLYMADQWGLSKETIKKYLSQYSSDDLRLLFPRSFKGIAGITSDEHDIEFDSASLAADFVGAVGQNNRSIQGTTCFPFYEVKRRKRSNSLIESMMSFANRMAEKFLRECELDDTEPEDRCDLNYACCSVPFVTRASSEEVVFYVKPRFISYYEVEIKPSRLDNGSVHRENPFECVAVGLATQSFQKNKRLPGWDSESFGYHGDDGAIFHGKGKRLSEFGPRYGCNDIVGCGFNHKEGSIFYTLNGKMLGTAFTEVPTNKELYPTVGIDSNCSVHFNFGTAPFKFNLAQHLAEV